MVRLPIPTHRRWRYINGRISHQAWQSSYGRRKKADLIVPSSAGLGNRFQMFVKGDGCSALNLEGIGQDVGGRLVLVEEIDVAELVPDGQRININNGDWGVIDLGLAPSVQALEHNDKLIGGAFLGSMETSVLTAYSSRSHCTSPFWSVPSLCGPKTLNSRSSTSATDS